MSQTLDSALDLIKKCWKEMTEFEKGEFVGRMTEKAEKNRQAAAVGSGK